MVRVRDSTQVPGPLPSGCPTYRSRPVTCRAQRRTEPSWTCRRPSPGGSYTSTRTCSTTRYRHRSRSMSTLPSPVGTVGSDVEVRGVGRDGSPLRRGRRRESSIPNSPLLPGNPSLLGQNGREFYRVLESTDLHLGPTCRPRVPTRTTSRTYISDLHLPGSPVKSTTRGVVLLNKPSPIPSCGIPARIPHRGRRGPVCEPRPP